MHNGVLLRPPLLEIGLKGYLYGWKVLELAKAADRMSRNLGIMVILAPQHLFPPHDH